MKIYLKKTIIKKQ